MDLEMDLD